MGVDFFETFSPVVKLTTVRFVLALVVSYGWFLHHLGVDNVFLHANLIKRFLWSPHLVCVFLLQKWFAKFINLYTGCTNPADSGMPSSPQLLFPMVLFKAQLITLFVQKTSDSFTALLVYVDDIVLTSNNLSAINNIKSYLHSQFHIKDLGNLKYFLRFEVARSHRRLVLHQHKYCLDILSEFGLTGCKPAPTPTNSSGKINETKGDILPDPTNYRCLVGKLFYLTHTRSNISFVVQQISEFMAYPCSSHLHFAFHILCYLKNAPG